MPIDLTSVLGPAASSPAPAPAPVSPPAETPPTDETAGATDEAGIPEAVLQIPEFSGLLAGKPPAVSVQSGFKSPETDAIMAHTKELADAGFGFYPGKNGTNVIFNTQFISGDAIKKADAEGKLADVATPFPELKASFDSVTGGGAAGGAPAAPADGSPASDQPPASSPALPAPAPAGVNKKLATARVNNVIPGGPTTGPTPGQGRILNSLLKQPV